MTTRVSQNGTDAARMKEAIRAAAPDLIVMTGDYLSQSDRLPRFAAWLDGLPPTPYGAFAVLGNHDYWVGLSEEIRAALSHAGVRVIGGTCATVAVDDRQVRLCGTDAPWGPSFEPASAGSNVAATLVLSHTPDNVYALAANTGGSAMRF